MDRLYNSTGTALYYTREFNLTSSRRKLVLSHCLSFSILSALSAVLQCCDFAIFRSRLKRANVCSNSAFHQCKCSCDVRLKMALWHAVSFVRFAIASMFVITVSKGARLKRSCAQFSNTCRRPLNRPKNVSTFH